MTATPEQHVDAALAAALVAIAPHALGGVVLAGMPSPGRDALVRWLSASVAPGSAAVRIPPGASIDALVGGLDLSATLASGRPVLTEGLLARANERLAILPMAERQEPAVIATLAAALDTGTVVVERDGVGASNPARFAMAALDESLADDLPCAPALTDRLAFRIDCATLVPAELAEFWCTDADIAAATARLDTVALPDDILRTLVTTASALGVASPRALVFASAAARAHAALVANACVTTEDAAAAARLVLASRATQLPAPAETDDTPPPPDNKPDGDNDDSEARNRDGEIADQVLAAAAAAIPDALLKSLDRRGGRARGERGRGAATAASQSRGRPAGTMTFQPGRNQRLNVLATLRAAAPWQRLRGAGNGRIEVRTADLKATRKRAPVRSTTIFVVDASGSAAVQRLAEVKGAIELLLGECYVRRDEVALIAFRGTEPECLLPPTRSLARAKRELTALPGGGGTPLAGAFDMATRLVAGIQRDGKRALVVVMTDGRGNIGRDGTPGHPEAADHARAAARELGALDAPTLVIDTGRRPREICRELAAAASAEYLPLPFADAATVAAAVRGAATARAA